MIEIVSETRCIECDICVKVCPANVFDATDTVPVIARQDDCQTCYLCEIYCPTDALSTSPNTPTVQPEFASLKSRSAASSASMPVNLAGNADSPAARNMTRRIASASPKSRKDRQPWTASSFPMSARPFS